jgi:hypothetical protein
LFSSLKQRTLIGGPSVPEPLTKEQIWIVSGGQLKAKCEQMRLAPVLTARAERP